MANVNENLFNLFNNYKNQQLYKQYGGNAAKQKQADEDTLKKLDVNGDGVVNNNDAKIINDTKKEKSLLKSENLFDFNNDGFVDVLDMFFVSQGMDIDGDGVIDEYEKDFLKKYKANITTEIFNSIKNNNSLNADDLLNFEAQIEKMNPDDKKFWKNEITKFENQLINSLKAKKDIKLEDIYEFFNTVKSKDMSSKLLGNNKTWQDTLTDVLGQMGKNLSKDVTFDDLLKFEKNMSIIKGKIDNLGTKASKALTKSFSTIETQLITNLQKNADLDKDGESTMKDLEKLWNVAKDTEDVKLFNGVQMSKVLQNLQKNMTAAIKKENNFDLDYFDVNKDGLLEAGDIASGDLNGDKKASLAEKIFMQNNKTDMDKIAKMVVYELKGITLVVDTSVKNSKFSYTLSGNKLTITGTNCKVDISKVTNRNISVVVEGSGVELNSKAKVSSITNNAKNATITGSAENDTITNNAAGAKIYGGAGNDTIKNYAKATIDGGDGNDTITNEKQGASSTVNGGAGNDTIKNYAKATIDGGDGNDTIYNYSNKETKGSTVKGGAGDDKIYNYGESAKVEGGAGNDTITNSGKNATVKDGNGFDTIGGVVYKNDKKLTGISEADGKMYEDGKVYTGVNQSDGKLYINGSIPKGLNLYDNILYDNGEVSQGNEEYKGRLFANGSPFSGVTTNRYVYKDGYLKCEIINNHDGYVPNREGDSPRIVDNTITFKSGEKITLNNKEIAVINNDGSVTITSKDGKTLIAEYSKDAQVVNKYNNGKLDTRTTIYDSNPSDINAKVNGVEKYTYTNGETRLESIEIKNSAGQTLYEESYTYENGKIIKTVHEYQYDIFGRIIVKKQEKRENGRLVFDGESRYIYEGNKTICNSRETTYDEENKRRTELSRTESEGNPISKNNTITNPFDGSSEQTMKEYTYPSYAPPGQGYVSKQDTYKWNTSGICTAAFGWTYDTNNGNQPYNLTPKYPIILKWDGMTAKELSDN